MRASGIDVFVRGAGPIGCALALALQGAGFRIALREQERSEQAPAFRPIALSYASRLVLERVGVWPLLEPTPIESVLVSQLGRFGRTRLTAPDAGVPALGYVVAYDALMAALRARLKAQEVERVAEDVAARCRVHAEGATPEAVEKRYAQDAVVALVGFSVPAIATAYERFTPHGPLAMLPFGERYAVIWSTEPRRAQALAECGEAKFLGELSSAVGRGPGIAREVASRTVQPLVSRVRPTRVEARAVYIGNAAQTLHPVAGQGLNLGLRDAWELAQILRTAPDPGDAAVLERYASRRRLDAAATYRVTDLLARAFVGDGRLAGAARGLALTALDVLPLPRRFFARRMIFGPSALP